MMDKEQFLLLKIIEESNEIISVISLFNDNIEDDDSEVIKNKLSSESMDFICVVEMFYQYIDLNDDQKPDVSASNYHHDYPSVPIADYRSSLIRSLSEVSHRACKAMSYSLDEVQIGQFSSNLERLNYNINIAIKLMITLVKMGLISDDLISTARQSEQLQKKMIKINKYLPLSIEKGRVVDNFNF